jgi:ABC-type transporter Mla subunit MlaD
MVTATDAAEHLANEQLRLKTAATESATAMEKLGTALGIVTAAHLEAEIVAIEKALAAARDTAGSFSQELLDMESEGGRQIESLALRAEGLRDGLGDIGEEAANAALGFDDLGESAARAGRALDDTGDAIAGFGNKSDDTGDQVDDLGEAIDGASESADTLRVGMQSATQGMQLAGAQAITTAGQFDEMRKAAGNAAAVAAALAGGGTLSQGGSRVRLQGGGSRLTNISGQTTRSSYALSQFGTGGRSTLDDDGNLRPA